MPADPAEAGGSVRPVPGEVTIKVRKDGPLLVRGPVTLVDHEGRPFVTDGDDVALCRCGWSERKPFCDGTHRRGFDGTCRREEADVAGGEVDADRAVSP